MPGPENYSFYGFRRIEAALARYETELLRQGASVDKAAQAVALVRQRFEALVYAILINADAPPGFHSSPDRVRQQLPGQRQVRAALGLADNDWYMRYRIVSGAVSTRIETRFVGRVNENLERFLAELPDAASRARDDDRP